MSEIWAEVLGSTVKYVSPDADFFSLGGDSIISARLVSKLRQQLKLNISVKDIFQQRSIRNICTNVLTDNKNQLEEKKDLVKVEQGRLDGEVSLLPIQQWFFANKFSVPEHFNQAFLVKTPSLDIEQLKASIDKLILLHDSFRLRFRREAEFKYVQYYDVNLSSSALKILNIKELGMLEGSDCFNRELQKIFTTWQSDFVLTQGNLYSIGYVYGFADNSARIYFALHHLIVDAVSCRILLDDLHAIYYGKFVEEKYSSYRQWTSAVTTYAAKHQDEKKYWHNIMVDAVEQEKLFTASGIMSDEATNNYCARKKLEREVTQQLLSTANTFYGTQINDLLLTALAYALYKLTGQRVHHITLEGHGRESDSIATDIDITRTLGWFTTMYPVRLSVRDDLLSTIIYTKENLRQIPCKGIGYGALFGYQQTTLPRISFNYLGQFGTEQVTMLDANKWVMVGEEAGDMIHPSNVDRNLLNINCMVLNGELIFTVRGSVLRKIIDKFTQSFIMTLRKIVDYFLCGKCICLAKTISDLQDFEPYVVVDNGAATSPCLFMLPPGDGGAESYFNNLVPQLQGHNLVLFNNFYFCLLEKFGDDCVKEVNYVWLANMYICYLKSLQGLGPYHLFGWSFGGVLAFEIARQLVVAGDEIASLTIVDSYFNFSKALQTVGSYSLEKQENNINYKYTPKKYLIMKNIFVKLIKPTQVAICKDANCKEYEMYVLAKYYVEKTAFNHLDDFLPAENISVIPMDADHDSWVHNAAVVEEIGSLIKVNLFRQ